MEADGHRDRMVRAGMALTPTVVRRRLIRHRLRARFGLRSIGPDFEYAIADNVTFGPECRLGGPVYISGSSIGAHTYIELGSRISATDVGKFCSIAPYALIGLPEHPSRTFASTHPIFYRRLPEHGWDLVSRDLHQEMRRTRIGHDVWVGAGVAVKSGVTIGDGAIIGAGAVVTQDVAPYEIWGGVPARRIRQRFEDETVAFLLELRWWDRGVDWLRDNAEAMSDVGALRKRVRTDG
jgi:acetyltransferase-like isoleucine patch superfamily enzyme